MKPTSCVHKKRAFYARFYLRAFHARVADFWARDFTGKTTDVVKAVERTISIGDEFIFTFHWQEWLPDTPFFRVRRVPLEKLQEGITESDLWEAPRHLTPAGRLNLFGESLLYTAREDPSSLMDEGGFKPGEYFILIRYILTEPIILKPAEPGYIDDELTDREQRIEEAISGFVRSVLVIPAEHYGPGTYAITQQILRRFYPLAPQESGWTYESTRRPGLINAAVEPKSAHAKLAITTVIAGYVESIDQKTDVYANYRAYSDGRVRQSDNIDFKSFPETGLPSLEDYIEWTEHEH